MAPSRPKPALKSPLDIFNRVARFVEKCIFLIGLEVLSPKFTLINLRSVTLFFIVVGFYTFSGYTIWCFKHDILAVLETLCVNGLVLPGVFKMVKGLKNRHMYKSLHEFGLGLYEDENANDNRYKILLEGSNRQLALVKKNVIILATGVAIFGLYPTYAYFKGERPNIVQILLPFIDPETETGYHITILYQFVSCGACAIGLFANDVFFMELISVYALATGLIGHSCTTLTALTEENEESPLYRKIFLRNIIVQIQDLESYMRRTKECFDSILSLQQILGSASISLALFVIISNDWYGGVGYVLFTYTQMMSMCILGSMVQDNNQELPVMLYKMNWYKLPLAEQKIILNLLQSVHNENPKEFWIIGLAPVNLETGTTITQKIYQIFMMMLSFLE